MHAPEDERLVRCARWAANAARVAIVWAMAGAVQLGCGSAEERPGAGGDPRGEADAGARADVGARPGQGGGAHQDGSAPSRPSRAR